MAKAQQIAFDFGFTEPEQVENPSSVSEESLPVPVEKDEVPVKETTIPDSRETPVVSYAVAESVRTITEVAEVFSEETEPIVQKTTPPKPGIRGRKSIKAMELEADLISIPSDEILFQKQYYSMQEVTAMFRVNHSLIRFWENEFSVLQPRKNKKGDRLFRPEDIKNLEIIYYLLRQKKYTIDGAKDYIKNKKKMHLKFAQIQHLENLKAFLLELKAGL